MHLHSFRITEGRDPGPTQTSPTPGSGRSANQIAKVALPCAASAIQKLKVADRSMRRLAAPFEKGPFDASPFGVSKNLEPRMPLGSPKLTLLKALRAEALKVRL